MKKQDLLKSIGILAASFCLFFTNVNGQTIDDQSANSGILRLGLGLNTGHSTSRFYDLAIGGDIRLQKDFYSNVAGMVSLGYTSFFQRDEFGAGSIDLIPLKAGLKLFTMDRLYLSGEIGPAFGTDDNNNSSPFGRGLLLVYTPGIGLDFNNGLDLGFRYEGLSKNGSNLGQLAFRLAYGFRL